MQKKRKEQKQAGLKIRDLKPKKDANGGGNMMKPGSDTGSGITSNTK